MLPKLNSKGVIHILPLLILITLAGLIAFLLVSSSAPFGKNLFGYLFKKPSSQAASNPISNPVTPSPSPSGQVSLSMSPATTSVTAMQTVTISLNMNTGTDQVSAAEVHVNYNPTFLQAQSITAGSFLPVVLTSGSYDNATGTATITLGSQPTTPASGTGTLATITFLAEASASTTVSYDAKTQTASINKVGNTLGLVSGSTITINPQCPKGSLGDVDCNNLIDIFDYNTIVTNFGKTGTNIAGDIDKNGKVDIFDYNILVTNFGK